MPSASPSNATPTQPPVAPPIARLSVLVQSLCVLALVGLPMAFLYGAVTAPMTPSALGVAFPGPAIPDPVPGWMPWTLAALGAPPMLAGLYVVWQIRALMLLYRRGQTLSAPAARTIRRIGLGLLVALVLGIFAHSAQVLALTLPNPPGSRALSIAVSSRDLGLALAAGLMVLIGWVMQDAAVAAEENRGFV